MELFAYHGVNPEEKENGQRFVLDIEAEADLSDACMSDCLDETVSYAKIIKTAREVFVAEKNDLIERAAERTAQEILERYERINSIRVLLKKPDAPINAQFKYVAVEIYRKRSK